MIIRHRYKYKGVDEIVGEDGIKLGEAYYMYFCSKGDLNRFSKESRKGARVIVIMNDGAEVVVGERETIGSRVNKYFLPERCPMDEELS